jgi:glutamate carboxypeptidase
MNRRLRNGERAPAISQWLAAHRAELVAFLEKLVAAESPSSEPELHAGVVALLGEALAEAGFRTRRLRGRTTAGQLFARPARRARGGRYQLVIGHCDTVWPGGTVREMPVAVRDGKLHGPGVFDMKGGLAQLVFALRVLAALRLAPKVEPVIFVNSDEEIGSRESTRHIVRLARRADRALILEPASGPEGRLKTARKGVGRYTVRIRGQAAHAGLDPQAGASAILELSHVIQRLFAMNDAGRGVTVNVGMVDGGIRPNVVAPESTATIDVRVPTQADAADLDARIRALEPRTPGATIEIEGGMGRPPMERTPGNRSAWDAARAAAEDLGIEIGEDSAGGASDGNTTSLYTPTLDGLGAVGGGAHARHEFIYLDKLDERAALLAMLLLAPALAPNQRRSRSGAARAGAPARRSSTEEA